MVKIGGDNQSNSISQPLRYSFVVVVTNADGVPVAGVTVDFAVQSGGGTLSVAQAITDLQGVAITRLTLGPSPGPNTVAVTADGIGGSPIIFTATGYRRVRGQLVSN
jgi:hypothetical protein